MSKKLKTGFIQKDHILFDEKAHTYTNLYTNETYSSVTGVLARLKTKFETEDILEVTAKRELAKKFKGTPIFLQPKGAVLQNLIDKKKEELRIEWDRLKNEAADFGTAVHAILEDHFTGEEVDPNDKYFIILKNFLRDQSFSCKQLLSEELLYADKYKLAGLADRIAIHEDDSFSIEDYKTNKTFSTSAFKADDKLKYPFDHLENCHLSLYSIQMGIYAYLYKQMTGRKLKGLNLYWYDRAAVMDPYSDIKAALNDYSNIDGKWVKIECSYEEDKIKYLLENFNKMEKH